MFDALLGVIDDIKPDKIIIGLPLRTDMRQSEMSVKVSAFRERLRNATGMDIELYNEMYTTVIASRLLHQNEKKSKEQRGIIDSAAAAVLLQDYLDKINRQQKGELL